MKPKLQYENKTYEESLTAADIDDVEAFFDSQPAKKITVRNRATGTVVAIEDLPQLYKIYQDALKNGISKQVGGYKDGALWDGLQAVDPANTKEFVTACLERAGLYGEYMAE